MFLGAAQGISVVYRATARLGGAFALLSLGPLALPTVVLYLSEGTAAVVCDGGLLG